MYCFNYNYLYNIYYNYNYYHLQPIRARRCASLLLSCCIGHEHVYLPCLLTLIARTGYASCAQQMAHCTAERVELLMLQQQHTTHAVCYHCCCCCCCCHSFIVVVVVVVLVVVVHVLYMLLNYYYCSMNNMSNYSLLLVN